MLPPICARRSADGFSSKPMIWPQIVELQDAHLRRIVGSTRLGRDGDVGVALDVRFDELVEVHAVQVIAREDEEVLGVEALEMARGLTHGVGGALEPVRAVGCLLGGQHFDEAIREHVQPVGLRDVPVEGRGVELRQHEDALEAGMQAVADRDVDQAVLARERNRGLRSHVGQREEARAAPAAENQGQDVIHVVNILSRPPEGCFLACLIESSCSS